MKLNNLKKTIVVAFAAVMALIPSTSAFSSASIHADAASYEYAMFPGATLYVTQGAYREYNAYSHDKQNAFDIAGNSNYTAPFTGKITAINQNYHMVMFQSLDKVYFADGTLDYMTVSFMHDNNISDLYVGKVIKQGTVMYQPGTYPPGSSTGNHVHLAVFKGKKSGTSCSGNYYPNKALFITSGTKISQTGRYTWVKKGSTPIQDTTTYFKKYTGTTTSIVTALNAIGADSSYAYRQKIAAANGISGYTGTAAQNTTMLNKLKAGTLAKPGSTPTPVTPVYFKKYTGTSTSIVTGLNAVGADSSYAYRQKIAAANGISGYTGTAAQNTSMLNKLKAGTLKKP